MKFDANTIITKIIDGALLTVGFVAVIFALRKFLPGVI